MENDLDYAKMQTVGSDIPGAEGYWKAVHAWSRLLQIDPRNTDALREICFLLAHLQQWPTAQQYYEEWLELDPNSLDALGGLARALSEMGRHSDARAHLQRALDVGRQKLAWMAIDLGNTFYDTESYEGALESYLDSVNLDSTNAVGWRNVGLAHEKLGQMDAAETAHRRAVAEDADDAEAQYSLAWLLEQRGKTEEAETHYREALSLDDGHYDHWRSLGSLLWQQNRLEEAEHALRRSLALEPDNVFTLVDLGITLSKAGKTDEAERLFRRAMDLEPEDAHAVYNLAYLYQQTGHLDRAEEFYRQAIRVAPHVVRSYENLANLLRDQQRYGEAEPLYLRAIQLAPEQASLYGNLGWQYYLLRDNERCIELSRKGLSYKPDMWWISFNIALAMLAQGLVEESTALYYRTATDCQQADHLDMALMDLEDLLRRSPQIDGGPILSALETRRTELDTQP